MTILKWNMCFTTNINFEIFTPEDEDFTSKRVVWDILQQILELYDEVFTFLL